MAVFLVSRAGGKPVKSQCETIAGALAKAVSQREFATAMPLRIESMHGTVVVDGNAINTHIAKNAADLARTPKPRPLTYDVPMDYTDDLGLGMF